MLMSFIAISIKGDENRIMDEKDLEILRLVQGNARLTAEAISQDVGLSPPPAVQKRLKRLRDTGVIEREIAVLAPAKLGGREMTIVVEVLLERENRAHLEAFKRKMRDAPACNSVTTPPERRIFC